MQNVDFELVIPYKATSSGQVNCLLCHKAKEDEVLGAISLVMDLTKQRKQGMSSPCAAASLIGSPAPPELQPGHFFRGDEHSVSGPGRHDRREVLRGQRHPQEFRDVAIILDDQNLFHVSLAIPDCTAQAYPAPVSPNSVPRNISVNPAAAVVSH